MLSFTPLNQCAVRPASTTTRNRTPHITTTASPLSCNLALARTLAYASSDARGVALAAHIDRAAALGKVRRAEARARGIRRLERALLEDLLDDIRVAFRAKLILELLI